MAAAAHLIAKHSKLRYFLWEFCTFCKGNIREICREFVLGAMSTSSYSNDATASGAGPNSGRIFSGGASYWRRRAATKSLGTRKSGLVVIVWNVDASRVLVRLGRRF